MSEKRVSNSKSKTRGQLKLNWLSKSLKVYQFQGIYLSGSKSDKTCVATLEYYPEQEKIFLSQVHHNLKSSVTSTSDDQLLKILNGHPSKMIGVNAPLGLPKCSGCKLKCPGTEKCTVKEVSWLRSAYKSKNKKIKPKKVFSPYLERCAEFFINNNLEEKFSMPHVMGANSAPQSARINFLAKHLKDPLIEVYPKLSLWRVGRALKIQKSYLRFHKHSLGGEEARMSILNRLVAKDIIFLYEQDQNLLEASSEAFDAFICALTAVLKFKKSVESKPKGFPQKAAWVEIPSSDCF